MVLVFLQLDPNDPISYYKKAGLLLHLNQIEGALNCYDKAIEVKIYFFI